LIYVADFNLGRPFLIGKKGFEAYCLLCILKLDRLDESDQFWVISTVITVLATRQFMVIHRTDRSISSQIMLSDLPSHLASSSID
jgi:hypothetical protein